VKILLLITAIILDLSVTPIAAEALIAKAGAMTRHNFATIPGIMRYFLKVVFLLQKIDFRPFFFEIDAFGSI